MSPTPREYTIMGLIAVMVAVILVVTTGIYIQANNNHDQVLSVAQSNAARLQALEMKRSLTIAKWRTSDDTMELIACMEHPNGTAARRACIDTITTRFKGKQ